MGDLYNLIPLRVQNYLSSVLHQSERKRVTKKRGRDGRVYVYTLRDFDRRESIFVHVPRAAGTSISRGLFGHNAGGHRTVQDYASIFGNAF